MAVLSWQRGLHRSIQCSGQYSNSRCLARELRLENALFRCGCTASSDKPKNPYESQQLSTFTVFHEQMPLCAILVMSTFSYAPALAFILDVDLEIW